MKILIIIIIAFLVLIYVYTFIKYKKRKNNRMSAVDTYRANYIDKSHLKKQSDNNDNDSYQQITKYNSSLDYIEWDDFVSEINEQKQSNDQKNKQKFPKRLQY